jgi:hypothetical protein
MGTPVLAVVEATRTALDIELEAALARAPAAVTFRRTSIDDANVAMRWNVNLYDGNLNLDAYAELPSVALDRVIANWRELYPTAEKARAEAIASLKERLAKLEGGAE